MKFKSILGIPEKIKWSDVYELLKKFKFVFVIYIFIWVNYIVWFGVFRQATTCFFDNLLGTGVGIGLSSSLLENLLFSVLIGFIIAFISLVASNKSPEDHEFERRVFAVLNRPGVDKAALIFFKNSISTHLAYYSKIYCEITINNFDYDSQSYSIMTERRHYIANMCIDHDYVDENATLNIQTDIGINGDFGKVFQLKPTNPNNSREIIPPVIDESDNIVLPEGDFKQPYILKIPANGETDLFINYRFWVRSSSDEDEFEYFISTQRFAKEFVISIRNNLNSKEEINFISKFYSSETNSSKSLESGKILYGKDHTHTIKTHQMYPGDKIKINSPSIKPKIDEQNQDKTI